MAQESDQRIRTTCLLILAAITSAGALYWLRPVMIPFVLAVFCSLALTPVIDLQMKHLRLPRGVALGSTMIIGVLLLSLLATVVSASVSRMADDENRYSDNFNQLVEKVSNTRPVKWLERLFFEGQKEEQSAVPEGSPVAPGGAEGSAAAPVEGQSSGESVLLTLVKGKIMPILMGVMNSVMNIVSQGMLVLIFMMFLLMGRPPTPDPNQPTSTWNIIEARVRGYILTKLLTSGLTGILTASVLIILDVPNAIVFGLLAFLLNFIPSIGSIIATLLPLPIVLVAFDVTTGSGFTCAILAIALPGVVQFLVGNLLEPKLMGNSLDLHPVVILLALIFWGVLWGPIGMLLATPIMAVLKILLEKLERTAPIAAALAGKFGPQES